MDPEWRPSGLAKPFYELLRTVDGQRCLPLGQEYEVSKGMLTPQCPQ
jgi:hypothetical protein